MAINIPAPRTVTSHATYRMVERRIGRHELDQASTDGRLRRRAGDCLEITGRNGVTYLTDLTGTVVITVLPRGARPVPSTRPDSGIARHRADRRGPKSRTDRNGPRR